MTNSKMLKKAGFFFMAIAACGLMLTFTSSNTEEGSNQQMIAQLSAELADMKTEVNILKTEEKTDRLGDMCFIGEVAIFAGTFAPRNWAMCDGRLYPISGNNALFSIIGCTYGGDCRSTYGVPDLRGRVPVGAGQGPGLTDRQLGYKFGAENSNLQIKTVKFSQRASTSSGTERNFVEGVNSPTNSVHTVQPSIGMNYIICTTGIFPSRS